MVPSRVFQPLVVRIALIATIPAAVIWAVTSPLPALIAGAGLLVVELWRIRRAVRSAMPDRLQFVPSRPADHPWVDTEGFRRELEALAELGFRPVADYQVVFPGAPDGLARLLIHPEARTYAEVSQTRSGGRSTSVATTLVSTMSDGWSIQTTSRPPIALNVAFMQTPRAMWRSLPQASPEDLLDDHLALRAQAAQDLRVNVAGDGTLSDFFALQQIDHQARRAAVLRTGILRGLARGVACERNAPTRWLGDYSGGAASGGPQPPAQLVAADGDPEGLVDGPDRIEEHDLVASREPRADAHRPDGETARRTPDPNLRDGDPQVGVDAADDAVALARTR